MSQQVDIKSLNILSVMISVLYGTGVSLIYLIYQCVSLPSPPPYALDATIPSLKPGHL